jgi:hypothetical protein
MEPITTAAITAVVSYLGTKGFEAAFETTIQELTQGSISWVKSFFFKEDGRPIDALEEYQESPKSQAREKLLKARIEMELEDNPEAEGYLLEFAKAIEAKSGNISTISHSKNVNTGTINAGGSINFGDHNYPSK